MYSQSERQGKNLAPHLFLVARLAFFFFRCSITKERYTSIHTYTCIDIHDSGYMTLAMLEVAGQYAEDTRISKATGRRDFRVGRVAKRDLSAFLVFLLRSILAHGSAFTLIASSVFVALFFMSLPRRGGLESLPIV